MGLAPHLLPLWIAHGVAHAVRYTSPTSRADLRRLVTDLRGYYDVWDTGRRATLRELLANEGVAVAAAQAGGAGVLARGDLRFTPPPDRPPPGAGPLFPRAPPPPPGPARPRAPAAGVVGGRET